MRIIGRRKDNVSLAQLPIELNDFVLLAFDELITNHMYDKSKTKQKRYVIMTQMNSPVI